jgi:hypothetical protein
MTSDQDTVLTELRIAVARLDEQLKAVLYQLAAQRETSRAERETECAYREHMEAKLAPLIESVDRGKGALAAATLLAGAIGAAFATGFKHLFGIAS